MPRKEVSPLKRHIEESPKLRELRNKRAVRRRRLVILLSILFLTLVGAFVDFARYPTLQLSQVVVEGNKVIDTDDILAVTEKHLLGNYAYVIPHRNAFFYPKKEIAADLLVQFPRFKNVQVYRTNPRTLVVTVKEVHGRALWCGQGSPVISAETECYFTDDKGKIVSLAPYYSGNVYPRFFGGTLSGSGVDPVGATFIGEEDFHSLLTFEEGVEKLGLPVNALSIGRNGENNFILGTGVDNTAIIRFLANDNYSILLSNLTAALGKDALRDELKKNRANLLYFDLRFTNKVYYKFNGE